VGASLRGQVAKFPVIARSEATEAIQSLLGAMDCFATLAMTVTYPSFNSACKNSLTALRAASAVAGLPPTCGLSSMQASL
jgi:hypothetical protein